MSSFNAMCSLAFAIVILPFSVATILINIFFIYCMFSSQEGPENIQKPPLNVLLGSLIVCNLLLSMCIIFFVMQESVQMPFWTYIVLIVAEFFALRTSFTASLGLNVFYYFQIVPARQPFLIWVKKHIKLFIYLMLFFEIIFLLIGLILDFDFPEACLIPKTRHLNSSSDSKNITYYQITDVCYYLLTTDFWLRCVYFLVGFGIMIASNTSTVLYLWRHLRRMGDSSSFSALHYQKQKRVAILSIIQTLLFFIYSVGLLLFELQVPFVVYGNIYILFSGLAFYCFCTSIILGVGQTKFRLCAVDIWKQIGEAVSQSNLNVGDKNGHFNCCLKFCYSNTENGEMLTIAHI